MSCQTSYIRKAKQGLADFSITRRRSKASCWRI